MNELLQKSCFSTDLDQKNEHYHDCHQIILITKGEINYCVNNVKGIAKEGQILIFSRYENHSIDILSNEYERYILWLEPGYSAVQTCVNSLLFNRPKDFNNVIDLSENFDVFRMIFSRIVNEYNTPHTLSKDLQDLLISELLIMIYRQLPDIDMFNENIHIVQKAFESDCSKQYTIKELAKQLNISPSSLSHLFKKITGFTIMGYLFSCRMAEAKRLLTTTDLPVGEIVERCGFSDSSNFSREFKKANGITPSKFRAINNRKKA